VLRVERLAPGPRWGGRLHREAFGQVFENHPSIAGLGLSAVWIEDAWGVPSGLCLQASVFEGWRNVSVVFGWT